MKVSVFRFGVFAIANLLNGVHAFIPNVTSPQPLFGLGNRFSPTPSTSTPTQSSTFDTTPSTTSTNEVVCSSITSCYIGGMKSNACKISSGKCPVCVAPNSLDCYAYEGNPVNKVCPFSGTDCTSVFRSGKTTVSNSTTVGLEYAGTTSPPPDNANETLEETPANDQQTAGVNSAEDSSSSGTILPIIGMAGAGCLVAVLAITMMRRRFRAEDSEDGSDEEDNRMHVTRPSFPKSKSDVPLQSQVAQVRKPIQSWHNSSEINRTHGGNGSMNSYVQVAPPTPLDTNRTHGGNGSMNSYVQVAPPTPLDTHSQYYDYNSTAGYGNQQPFPHQVPAVQTNDVNNYNNNYRNFDHPQTAQPVFESYGQSQMQNQNSAQGAIPIQLNTDEQNSLYDMSKERRGSVEL